MPTTHDGRRGDESFDVAVGLPPQRRPLRTPPDPRRRGRTHRVPVQVGRTEAAGEPDVAGPAAGRAPRGARGGRHRLRLRHLLLVVVASLALIPATAATLGLVGLSPGQFGLGADTEPGGPTAIVGGTDGVFPGGPAAPAEVALTNPDVAATDLTALTVTGVSGDGGCPRTAWQVTPPVGGLPSIDPGATVRTEVGVALVPDAPDACQGLVAHLTLHLTGTSRAGRAQTVEATVTARTASLGTPSAGVSVHDGAVVVVPAAAPAGPRPSGFDVALVDAKGTATPLCTATTTGCTDRAAPVAGQRQYRVTARLAGDWHRVGPLVRAWTPPPGPALSFAGWGTSRVRVQAPGGASDYEVSLLADGIPVLTWPVPAGTTLARTVPVPPLPAGRHRLVAVSRFQGWRAPSSTLRLELGVDGTTTRTEVDAPDPVTVDPGAPPVVTTVAPTGHTTGAPAVEPQPQLPTRTLNPVVRARPVYVPPPPAPVDPAGPADPAGAVDPAADPVTTTSSSTQDPAPTTTAQTQDVPADPGT